MGYDEQQAARSRAFEILNKPDELTDADLSELRRLISQTGYLGPVVLGTAELRTSVELIASIRGFDAASAGLINTTNKLTRHIRILTVLAVLFAGASLYVSCHPKPIEQQQRPPAGMDLNL